MSSAKIEFETAGIFIICGSLLYAVMWWDGTLNNKVELASFAIVIIGFLVLGSAIRIAVKENLQATKNYRVMIESESDPRDEYDVPVKITTVIFPERRLEKTRLEYWTPEKFDS